MEIIRTTLIAVGTLWLLLACTPEIWMLKPNTWWEQTPPNSEAYNAECKREHYNYTEHAL